MFLLKHSTTYNISKHFFKHKKTINSRCKKKTLKRPCQCFANKKTRLLGNQQHLLLRTHPFNHVNVLQTKRLDY